MSTPAMTPRHEVGAASELFDGYDRRERVDSPPGVRLADGDREGRLVLALVLLAVELRRE